MTTLVQVLAIGLVWAYIWRQPIDEFLPYYGIGQILFSFVTQTINEGANTLIGNAKYYRNDKMPFTVAVLANLYHNALIALHNLPVAIALLLWSDSARLAVCLGFLPALAMTIVFVYLCSYSVAMLCARFRDLIQVVGIVLQNIFLLTPVMWKLELIPERFRLHMLLNPFAAMLETLRNPLIGLPVNPTAYGILAAWVAVFLLVCAIVRRRIGATLIFWI